MLLLYVTTSSSKGNVLRLALSFTNQKCACLCKVKTISMSTFRNTRNGKKGFLWWAFVCLTTRCYTTSHLHQVFSFRFRSNILAFFTRISSFKSLEFKEFNNTIIIPFALVGYETGYSQLGAIDASRWLFTISYPTE